MRLVHKIQKLGDPRLLKSIRKHFGRVFLTRRLVFSVTPERIIASIDREGFNAIHERHAVDDPGPTWPKYLDLKRWIRVNLLRAARLHLDYGRRRRVLDIGSGAGYFLYICKWFRHDVLGLDIDDVPLYPEMTRLLKLPRVIWRIQAFVPLPDLGEKFDVVTGYMICFNNHKVEGLWGVPEWEFFLEDLAGHLKPDGCIWFELNPEPDGIFTTPELREFLRGRGARVDGNKVIFSRPPRSMRSKQPAFASTTR